MLFVDCRIAICFLIDFNTVSTGAIAKTFHLGYAPPGWDALCSQLGTDPVRRQQLIEAGHVTVNDRIAGKQSATMRCDDRMQLDRGNTSWSHFLAT